MTDARERFLREIAGRLPPDRIEELHLFPPLRQGGMESGVAVIAARPEEESEVAPAGRGVGGSSVDDHQASEEEVHAPDTVPNEAAALNGRADDLPTIGRRPAVSDAPAEIRVESDGDTPLNLTAAQEAPDLGPAFGVACDPTEAAAAPPARPRRHTVYTARYRHTLKGPERGKWEFDLVAEADAPLVTVDAVVRGVQRRTGDLGEPELLRADELRSALDGTGWRATTG